MAFASPVSPSTEVHAGAVGNGVDLAASQATRETLWLLGSRWLVPSAGWEQWGWGAALGSLK